ncbi:multicopper oxidase [Sphaerobolus stellatus SS14]|nr:multicopper oxidase [Sphaerobolus stellatus SS14]
MPSPSTYAAAFLALLASPVYAATHEIWWNITYTTANPDNAFERHVIGVNGTWPPPPVEITSNDTLVVHAINGLGDASTALHHHGMFFNSTSWADGAVGVTQCAIPPGETFTYNVDVADWNQWGTYWIHGHFQGQYVDGLRTPFVIHNTNPGGEVHANAYDEEYTIILGDWYHEQHSDLVAHFLSEANPGGAEPVPDTGLIYFTKDGQYLPPLPNTVDGKVGFNENATLPFVPGKTYRLRILNASGFSAFFFWIDGHEMRVIEVDGTDVEEYSIDQIPLTVAQRYSILVTARNDTDKNWVIHANMDTDMFDTVPDTLQPNITSSISYSTSGKLQEAGTLDEYLELHDTVFLPIPAEAPLPPPDQIIDLNVFFDTLDNGVNRAMFNNITYNSPLTPSLLTQLTMGPRAVIPQIYGPTSFVLNHNEVVELRLYNWDAGKHPFHLHGHKFQIVYKSYDITSDDPSVNPPPPSNTSNAGIAFPNPIRRDTVQMPSMGVAYLRLRADNPGAWLFHCHIEWHLDAGLAVSFIEAPLEAQKSIKAPSYVDSQCLAQGLPISGNAAGHNSTTDLTGLPLGPYPQNNGWHARGIGAMAGCVLSAVLGWIAVGWYSFHGGVTDEEYEVEERERTREKKPKWGVFKRK